MKKLFSKKPKNKLSKEQEALLFPFYDLEQKYKEIEASEKFISYSRLMSSVLLSTGLSFESDVIKEYKSIYTKALVKKYDLVYLDFIISFGLNKKFSPKFLVPILVKEISSNTEHFDLRYDENLVKENFLTKLNNEINSLMERNFYVEVLPGIIIYFSSYSKEMKLVFKKDYTNQIAK
ncbi:MSC_0623 family F1-like ATPase-associated protein [Mycoplasma sp. 480]|uniref:MSC_0623 family F1-like ATPase-associated protein n=1 Tax=Mycoplasma sp. 480 TaxID=3440155 RepID=UPI003F518C69